MKPTTSLHLDIRRTKNNEKYPLKIRITYLRQRKYYKTDIDLTYYEWEKVNTSRPRGVFKEIRTKADNELKKVDATISGMEIFSFAAFEKAYFRNASQNLDLFTAFNAYYQALNDQQRVNTAESYNNSILYLVIVSSNSFLENSMILV